MWITLLIIVAAFPIGLLIDWAMWTRAMVWIDPCLDGATKETYRSSLSVRVVFLGLGIAGVGIAYQHEAMIAGFLGLIPFLGGHGMGVWKTYCLVRSGRFQRPEVDMRRE
jgi:hypothetical protein